ncbi:MAG: amidase domain-containing protein [Chloroflexi bacterium]|nr:amidase domain-containing protein [Chloroflexota bacterium]MBU1662460.1 amidase domain-containing protein [Chloroflexota bacterium]
MQSIRSNFRHFALAILITGILIPLIGSQTQPVSAAQTIVDSTSSSLVWSSNWYTYPSDTAYNGSFRYTSAAGATVSLTFTGSSITYVYTMSFNRGAAEVYIDGVIIDRLNGLADDFQENLWTRIPRRQTVKTYSGLGSGQHTITIKAAPGEDGTRIYTELDAFIINPAQAVSGVTYDDTTSYATVFNQAHWHTWHCSECYNGSFQYTDVGGAGVRLTFTGDSITWYFTKSPNRGKAMVTIDGENKNWYYGYFDMYNPTIQRNQHRTFGGLGGGTHTIVIYNVHQKNPASSNYFIDIDRLVIGSTNTYQRTTAANYADARVHAYNCYYYFSGHGCYISANDCMNFSSQAMHAAGFPYVPANPPWYNWPEQWWYNATTDTSSDTWDYVPTFITYQAGRPAEFTTTTVLTNLRRGDLIPLDVWDEEDNELGHDDVADHMRIVVGAGMSSPFNADYTGENAPNLVFYPEFNLLIDQHSYDRWQVPWDYKTVPADFLDFKYIKIIKH